MATIPITQGPSVRDTPLQGGFLDTPDVSSGLKSLAGGLDAVGKVAEKVAVDQETQRAYATDTAIKSAWITKDADLRKTYRGSNVAGYQEEVSKFWDDAQVTAQGDLGNLGRRLVSQSLGAARLQAQSSSQNYFTGEVDRSQNESFTASKQVEIQRGLVDGRPEAIATSAEILRQRNAQQGGLKGWSTEQLQAANLRDLSDLYGSRIAQLATTDPTAAKATFDAHRDDIDASRHGAIEHTLNGELQNQQARQTAASLATKPLADQLEEVSKINDPQLREKTLTAVRENHGLLKAAQQQREGDAADKAWQMVGQGARVPEVTLATMDGKQRVQLQDYLREKAEHAAAKGSAPVKTDPTVHAALWDKLLNDPDGFKSERIAAYAMKLSGSDLEQLMQQQKAMRNPKDTNVATLDQQIGAAANSIKLDKDKRGTFAAAVFTETQQATTDKGKALDFKERQAIVDRLALQGEVRSGSWFLPDSNRRLYEVAPTDRTRFVAAVPDADRSAIAAAFKARGVANPTDAQISAAFARLKGIK
ncbi:MAG: hypothetical protein ABI605_16700 [Rhizobacter sp.]